MAEAAPLNLPAAASLFVARQAAAAIFAQAGIETAREDATLLLCAAAGVSRARFVAEPGEPLPPQARERFACFVERRMRREPVTRILGRRGFWDIDLEVRPGVLDPRGDSETVIRAAIDLMAARQSENLSILDIGCGSGALVCALLREFPAATGIAIDISEPACDLTRRNAQLADVGDRLEVRHCGWDDLPPERFDLVVSNPPYIPTSHLHELDREVRDWDPAEALDGGPDGLDAYRALARLTPSRLRENGWCILEIGHDQPAIVPDLLQKHGFGPVRAFRDLTGRVRVVAAGHRGTNAISQT